MLSWNSLDEFPIQETQIRSTVLEIANIVLIVDESFRTVSETSSYNHSYYKNLHMNDA